MRLAWLRRHKVISTILAFIVGISLWLTIQVYNYDDSKAFPPTGPVKYLVCAWYAGCNPFKIADPGNPMFNLNRFSLLDYAGEANMRYAFQHLFPVGTPKDEVRRILVIIGRSEEIYIPELNAYRYSKELKPIIPIPNPNKSLAIVVEYDGADRVKEIRHSGRKIL